MSQDPPPAQDRPPAEGRQAAHRRPPETRALWWLFGGIALLAVSVVALAPELLGDLGGLGSLALLVIAAGLPGLAAVLWIAARRRSGRTGAPADRDVGGHPQRGA